MEDMLPEINAVQTAEAVGNLLRDHKGEDVLILDLREMEAWTDFFVIATAASDTHLDGLERHIKELCREKEIEILRRSRKPGARAGNRGQEDEWRVIDLGSVVIHLMSRRARAFYDLERLYSMAAGDHSSSSG